MRNRLGWVVVVLFLLAPGLCGADAASDKTVKLVIDYNDGVEKVFRALPWKDGMTVFDAMQQAKEAAHGITFQHTGKDATAFLTRIDDLTNQGSGKAKKNWIYRVNGKLATRSFGVYKLQSGDEVVWKFGSYTKK